MVWVSGPDAIGFLDGLLSQNITALEPGETARSLLLAPNGKLRATLFVLRGEDRAGLVCDATSAETVDTDLNRFKIRVDADIKREVRPLYEVWGAPAATGDAPPAGRWAETEGGIAFAMPFTRSDLPRVVLVGLDPTVPIVAASALDALRIELGEPVMGVDLDDKTIPQEGVAVAEYVDFSKGCYLGQELVARIDSRGHVNRWLAGLQIDDEEVPPPGTQLEREGRGVGSITSAAWSASRGLTVALAMLRVEITPGESLHAGGAEAKVVALPMP